ncbi:hypothetical protein [Streptomyces sp. MNU89]|uniref:hypothetical protein n=1 Tax=unclassified Streptomyces TaxID=2593676 RepID=UPI0035A89A4C
MNAPQDPPFLPRAESSGDGPPPCSAKGCRAPAVWVLAWNNPKLHTPERRKTWLACEEHREHLSSFLGARGFLKDVVPFADWESSRADGRTEGTGNGGGSGPSAADR